MEHMTPMEIQLENQLREIDREELRLKTELLDVFADVTTPEGSEDEEEHSVDLNDIDPNKPSMVLFQKMLNAKSEPAESARYAGLYREELYRRNVNKKMKKMRNLAKKTNMDNICGNELFIKEAERIKNTYEDDGERTGLYDLITLYCHLDNKKKEDLKIVEEDKNKETDAGNGGIESGIQELSVN